MKMNSYIPKFKSTRWWSDEYMKDFIEKYGYYDGDLFFKLEAMAFCAEKQPTDRNIYILARDIVDKSSEFDDDRSFSMILALMGDIMHEVVHTHYYEVEEA